MRIVRPVLGRLAAICRKHPLAAAAVGLAVLLVFGFLHIADEMAEERQLVH